MALKKYKLPFISALITFLFLVVFMITFRVVPFGNERLMIYSDGYFQTYPYFFVFLDKLKNGDSFFYYWNDGFGGAFLPIYFYYLSSPLSFLALFFGKDNLLGFMTITVVIRLMISSGTCCYCLLNKYEDNNNRELFALPLSLGYGIGSYMLAYYFETMWLDVLAMFPLIMLGYRRLIHDKKPLLYIVCLSISAWCNYYMVYSVALFLIITFLLDEHDSLKEFLRNGIRFGLSSLLSVGIAFFPIIISILSANNIDSSGGFPEHKWSGNIFNIIRELYIFTDSNSLEGSFSSTNLYCGTFVIALLFIYISLKNIKLEKKIKSVIFITLLLVSMNELVLNYIWHSFRIPRGIPNRFSFLLVFLLIEISYETIMNLKKENIKGAVISGLIAFVFPIVSYFFVDFDSTFNSHIILIISMSFILVYMVLLMAGLLEKKIVRVCNGLIVGLMICELLINGIYFLKELLPPASEYNGYVNHEIFIDAKGEIADSDRNNYRSELQYNYNLRTKDNYGSVLGLNTISSFSSYLSLDLVDNMRKLGNEVNESNNIITDHGNPEVLEDVFAIKNVLVEKDNDNYQDRTNYTKIFEDEKTVLYSNDDALALGYGASKKILALDSKKNIDDDKYIFENYNPIKYINSFASGLYGEDLEIYEEAFPECSVTADGGEVMLLGDGALNLCFTEESNVRLIHIDFTIEQSGSYYLNITGTERDEIIVYVNDIVTRDEVFSDLINGVIYIGELTENDKVRIEINGIYLDNTFSDVYYSAGIAKTNQNAYLAFINSLKSNQLTINEKEDDYIKGSIHIDRNQILVTSIPFEKGWHLYDNGSEIECKKVAGAFLGAELEEGTHEIYLKYTPPGFCIGIIVSVSSICILIVYIVFTRKRNNEENGL